MITCSIVGSLALDQGHLVDRFRMAMMRESVSVYFAVRSHRVFRGLDTRLAPEWLIGFSQKGLILGGQYRPELSEEEWRQFWTDDSHYIYLSPPEVKGKEFATLPNDQILFRAYYRLIGDEGFMVVEVDKAGRIVPNWNPVKIKLPPIDSSITF